MDKLRDYQREGVEFLTNTERPNKILADDTGTGKTAQAATAIIKLLTYGWPRIEKPLPDYPQKVLIICPLAVKNFWRDEICRWGSLPPEYIYLSGRGKGALDGSFPRLINIVHWEQLSDDYLAGRLRERSWQIVVADEVHRIKNRKTKRAKNLKRLKASCKFALSANVIVNSPDDLWSILNWLYPQDYRSYWQFFEKYVPYKLRHVGREKVFKQVVPGVKNIEGLSQRIKPIFLRRTKAEVLSELPAVTRTRLVVELSDEERALYKEVQEETLILLESGELLAMPNQIARLVRLQQAIVYAGPFQWLITDSLSTKVNTVSEICTDNPVPTIIFSKFRDAARQIAHALLLRGLPCNLQMGGWDPEQTVREFQGGEVDFVSATYGTLSEGVTLSRAERLIELDQTWSPLQQSQAEGRVHRIGTKKPVEIIRIIAKDTIDEKIEAALEHKWNTLELLYECI